MIRRRAGLLIAIACAGLLLSGCDGSPKPEPSTSAPLFAGEAEAFAAAEATYRAYVDALNAVDLGDPATFEPVFALTTGELNKTDREGLSAYHAAGNEVSGRSVVELAELLQYERTTGDVTLAVCLDVSGIDLVDSDGESLVTPDRVAVQSLAVGLEPRGPQDALAVSSISGRDGVPKC